ncbi:MAG TPA: hypothetical protein VF532_24790 [Candidatus Angelobacter sp.]
MTLQPANAPSFYTFTTFRLGKRTLLYGAILSIVAFWAVALAFTFGISETLWTPSQPAQSGTVTPSPARNLESSHASLPPQQIVPVALPKHVLRSLTGTFVSAAAHRTYLITLHEGLLNLEIDGLEKVVLIPVSNHSLYAGEERRIEFAATPAGAIDQLEIYDHGRHIVAHRQKVPAIGTPGNHTLL